MATNQEILESYQQGIGAGEGQVNTQMLIQALRERQRRAEASDVAAAKNLQSFGKAGLNVIKARRDFLLAKRTNPDLKFTEFMADPKTSAKYMQQGAANIVSGESPKIGLRETLNPFSKEYARNLNVESFQSSPEYQALIRNTNQAIPSAEASMLPDQKLSAMPEFDDYSNLASPPPASVPPPMGNITEQGLRESVLQRPDNLIQQALGGVSPSTLSPEVLSPYPAPQAPTPPLSPMGDTTGQALQQTLAAGQPSLVDMSRGAGVNLPISLPPVSVIGKAPVLTPLRQAPLDMNLQNIKPVSVPDPMSGAAEKAGTFGNILGAANAGKSLLNVFNAKTNKNRKDAMMGAAASGASLINPALGAGLSIINMLRNRR